MKPSLWQLTKREWQSLRGSRAMWAGMLAAGAILGVIGPFGTDAGLTVLPRVLYWLVTTVVTFATGYCVTTALINMLRERGHALWLVMPSAVFVSATLIYGEVLILNLLTFGSLPRQVDIAVLGGNILLIVAIVTVAVFIIAEQAQPAEGDAAEERAPRLLDRLPAPIRGPLISLSVTDHYVHVTTAHGKHMLLMRLSDAIAETDPTPGFQVHRSHWVAQEQIACLSGTSRKYEILLKTGDRLPVSRTYLPQLKEAGFLPRSST